MRCVFCLLLSLSLLSLPAGAAEEEPVTPKELGLSPASQGLEVVVISDGELSLRSLGLCGKDQAWVRRRLQERGLGPEQVFLMTVRTDGKWRVRKKYGPGAGQVKRQRYV